MLHIINNNDSLIVQTESMITRCSEIKHQIKVLQAEYDRLKASMISGYFKNAESFTGREGIELATYKSHITQRFQTTKFKAAYPVIYDDYSEMTEEFKFLIKI